MEVKGVRVPKFAALAVLGTIAVGTAAFFVLQGSPSRAAAADDSKAGSVAGCHMQAGGAEQSAPTMGAGCCMGK